MQRRAFLTGMLGSAASLTLRLGPAQLSSDGVFMERPVTGTPHKGKVLAAIQAHSDDIPLFAAGTVAKLIQEGYTGYLVRATNDDMGDAAGLGTPGTIGENVLGNERDNARSGARPGLQAQLRSELQQPPHGRRLAERADLPPDLSHPPAEGRYRRLLGPLGARRGESRPLRTLPAGVEAACWMAGRVHDYPEQFAPGSSRKPFRTNITTRAVPRSPAWWTSAAWSIRRSTPTAPT